MVQTERDQSTLDAAIDEGSEETSRIDQVAKCIDTGLDRRPYEIADEACENTKDHTHDRDETCAGEESQGLGQNLFVELITGQGCQKSCKNTAEHTHLQGLDTKGCRDRAVLDVGTEASVREDGTVDGEQYIHGCQHDQIEDRCGKNCDTLFLLGHTKCYCQCEDQCQVAEYSIAGAVEHLEEHIKDTAFMQYAFKMIRRDGCCICEGASDTEQNTCGRKDRDRQEQRLTDLLGDGKSLRAAITFLFFFI